MYFNKKNTIGFLAFLLVNVHANSQFIIQSGAQFKTTNGAVVTLQDVDLYLNEPVNQSTGDGGFRFSGTANSSIIGFGTPVIDQFQMAKTGTAQVNVQQNLQVAGSVNFQGGILNLGSNQLTLLPSALLINESESSRITAGTGSVSISVNLNTPAGVNPGNLGAVISSSQNLGVVSVIRRHNARQISAVSRNSINRIYSIAPALNSGLNASLKFQYFDAELNGRAESQLSLWRSSDDINWTGTGYSFRDPSLNFVQIDGLSSFSSWTLTDADFPTSLSDNLIQTSFLKLYPNPIRSGMIKVLYVSSSNGHGNIRVTDMSGKIVFQQFVSFFAGENIFELKANSLAKGTYQLSFWIEGKKAQTISFVQL